MKAVLLAAGLGSRLGAVTLSVPKCMLEVGGKSLLLRNLELAAAAGVTEAAVNLHHCADVVVSAFPVGSTPVPIRWCEEPELLGTAGTLSSLGDWLGGEQFLVIYADNLLECDVEAMMRLHRARGADATLALFERDDVSHSGVAEVAADSRITRFVEKPKEGESTSHWVSAGLILAEPLVAAHAPANGDIGRDLLPDLLGRGVYLAGHCMGDSESLHWVDTPGDLERTRSLFAEVAR
jgi:mannose-1-phosphate guanylyltransferase